MGEGSNTLGIRRNYDIKTQSDGTVLPKTGGMSVAPSLRETNPLKIPKRFLALFPEIEGIQGGNSLRVWTMGAGVFQAAPLTPKLALTLQNPTHGFVEPDAAMPLADYEAALYETRDEWILDEPGMTP